MKSRALLLASLLLAPTACASRPPATSEQFLRIEQGWIDALQSHDTAALDRLLAEDFVDSTYCGGVRTREDVLAGPPAAPRRYRSVRLEDLKVRTYGRDAAIVTGVNLLQGTGPEDSVRVRFTDVFVWEHGRWRAAAAQETIRTGSCGTGQSATP